MKSQTVILQNYAKVKAHALKYRVAREALACLSLLLSKPETWGQHFQILKEDDVRGLPVETGLGEGNRTLSWIWLSFGAGAVTLDQAGLTDCEFINLLISPKRSSC